MAICDPREEEAQVLRSIFDEEELMISDDYNLEYKVGEAGTTSSFIVQVYWPEGYPDVLPCISMNSFYNHHIPLNVKEKITEELVSVAEGQLGSALTFHLIEYLKENHERFAKSFAVDKVDKSQSHSFSSETSSVSRKQDKLPQLSKSQKRKHLDRLGQDGELPRGWNWVSVIKHLQQTGSAS
ncbi:hypothetical protein Smp_074950 [Schistosoma mansoni]|uniref:RWD domain-containing protein n=1 Tax=Schistosoma mansoni TaxID=6183 RepID=G4VH13_SCHMA|nr:hypothetical protein Smp_074950 [Schistosoma mansoni]|eukprot:XP_018650898.1 hypothetical protein Smp_074950 [Schistosoma mansoni]